MIRQAADTTLLRIIGVSLLFVSGFLPAALISAAMSLDDVISAVWPKWLFIATFVALAPALIATTTGLAQALWQQEHRNG